MESCHGEDTPQRSDGRYHRRRYCTVLEQICIYIYFHRICRVTGPRLGGCTVYRGKLKGSETEKQRVGFLPVKGKDRVVRQPGSLNCYETVGEKAFLSPTCISFWKVIVLLFSPHSEIYLNSSPLPFLSCTTLVTQLRLSAALRLDTRNYGMFHHIFNNDKRTVRDVSLRFSQRGTLFHESLVEN